MSKINTPKHASSVIEPTKSNKLIKITLRAQIKKYIQDGIKYGRYKPGDRIPEIGLAKELNVSQAPVREAILELSAMGLLEERPYSGAFVRELTADDIADIYNIRAYIEEFAARRAAEFMSDEQLESLEAILDDMRLAVVNQNLDDFNQADVKFHEMVLDGAQSKALKRTWKTLQMGEWTSFTLQATKRTLQDLLDEHKTIYEHLTNRSSNCAAAAMLLHISSFINDMVKYLDT